MKRSIRVPEAIDKLLPSTTWRRVATAVVFFLVFSFLLSSGLFVTKVHLKLGEPSPETILAPWDLDIKDLDRYHQDQDAAEKATAPVYKPDDEYVASVSKDISRAFASLRDSIAANLDERGKVSKLRQTSPFTSLPDGVLAMLLKARPDEIKDAETAANEIILGRARNLDYGAKTEADVAPLRDRMKDELNRYALSDELKVFLTALVDAKINHPTLVVDEEGSQKAARAARDNVKIENYIEHYKTKQKIIGIGDIADKRVFQVLEAYGFVDSRSPWKMTGGLLILTLVGMGAIVAFAFQYRPHVFRSTRKLVLIGLLIALVLIITKGINALNLGSEFTSLAGFLIPVAWATTSVAILVDAQISIVVALVLAVFVGVLADPRFGTAIGMQVGLVALFGGITGVHSVSRLSQRSDLARAGLFVSAGNIVVVSGIALMSGMQLVSWTVGILLAIINGLASSVLTVGTLHWFEAGFEITSAVRLLELSNPNRPLLKRLLMEAPGTYHHSILVGNLAESAAETIHADATLVRVGSMYHDIGKLKRPYFFIENQFSQENPHDKIAPTLSSLIITSHVKDGLEMGKEHKLPQAVLDIIYQHHGDSLVTFFYHKAKEENEDVPEEAFRYDAPRPQTKEAALVCLADSVEAAVRSMRQPTPGRIEGLVRKIIKEKFNDEQLDQCDLTFKDLDRIAIAFVRVLSGIFHSRVEYPELPAAKADPGKKADNSDAWKGVEKASDDAKKESDNLKKDSEHVVMDAEDDKDSGDVTNAPEKATKVTNTKDTDTRDTKDTKDIQG